MKRFFLAAVAIAILISCTDAGNALKVLQSQGYRNITITGYGWFGCSDDDFYQTAFTATGQNGQPVDGVVCQGIFLKGATVRMR